MAHLVELSVRLGRRIVFAIDDQLRRFEGIYAFSHDPNCVIRISRSVSRKEQVLADGSLIRVGDPIVELHWWNEHIARLASTGSSLQWGLQFYRHTYHSVLSLSHYLQQASHLGDVVALHGETTFPDESSYQHHANAFRRMGFELVTLPPPGSTGELVWHSLRRFHVWALAWASNPASLRRKGPCAIVRCDVWISRQSLLERCAAHGGSLLGLDRQSTTLPAQDDPLALLPGAALRPPLSGPVGARSEASDPWTLLRARMREQYTSWKR